MAAMKKVHSFLKVMAAVTAICAGFFFQSCSESAAVSEGLGGHSYTFALEPLQDAATKTVLASGDVIEWQSSDRLGTFAAGTSNIQSYVIPGAPATFTISLTQAVRSGEKLYFYYPYSETAGQDPASARLSVPVSQKGDLSSLPMAALPYTAAEDFVSGKTVPSIRFCPLGAIVEFSIYTEVAAWQSEKIQSVTFESKDGIAGEFSCDLTSVSRDSETTLGIRGLAAKTVTVTPPAAVPAGRSRGDAVPLYMTVAPGTHAGTLTVTTDKASYVYDLDERTFVRNAIKPVAVNLTAAARRVPRYELVTSLSDITDGRYIIAADCGGVYYALPGSIPISSYSKVDGTVVTVKDNVVTSADAESMAVDIRVKGTQLSVSNGSSYLAQPTVNKTDVSLSSSEFMWNVTSPSAGKVRLASTLSNSSTRCLLFRTVDGNVNYYCFGAYSTGSFAYSGYYDISLFKYTTGGAGTPVTPPSGTDPVIQTGAASGISSSGATVSAVFRDTGTTPRELRFEYGTSSSSLGNAAYYNGTVPAEGVAFSVTLSSLLPSTTYYYRAVMQVGDRDIYGEVRSFTTSAASQSAVPGGLLELPATSGSEDYVGTYFSGSERNYTMYYSYDKYAAMWVAYPLCKAHTSGSEGSSWKYNPNIAQKYQVDIVSHSYGSSYNAGTYARGHQIPNGSRKNNSTMNAQTYYATNQTPQIQNGFNGSIWSAMENAVRAAIPGTDTLYVVTGPVYQTVGGNETIKYLTGASGVNPASLPVPNYYFKAVLKVKRSGNAVTSAIACGFWMEHKTYSNSDYARYAVSIDEIEAKTGLDLFVNLPDDIEVTAEKNSSWDSFLNFK